MIVARVKGQSYSHRILATAQLGYFFVLVRHIARSLKSTLNKSTSNLKKIKKFERFKLFEMFNFEKVVFKIFKTYMT